MRSFSDAHARWEPPLRVASWSAPSGGDCKQPHLGSRQAFGCCLPSTSGAGSAENAPLRVVDADGLRSAPITFFDQQLLSFANASWQKPARIIGETMREWIAPPTEPYFQAGEMILGARIIALVEGGVLEGRGDLWNIQQSDVRLTDSYQRSTSG